MKNSIQHKSHDRRSHTVWCRSLTSLALVLATLPLASADPNAVSERAQKIGVTDLHVQALDTVLDYNGGPDANYAILTLEKILSAGAVETDLGRAEVLRALFHVYEVLLNEPPDVRESFKPHGSPRQILVPIVGHEIGPEETRVLDERIHLLLYHGWISNIRGIEKFVFRLIESEHLAPSLYDTLHAKMLETLRRSCRTSADRDAAGQPVQLTFCRSQPAEWPCILHRLFMPLWDSPRATQGHRVALYEALEDALLGNNRNIEWAQKCSVYVSWLRARNWITRDHIQGYFDRWFDSTDPVSQATELFSYTLFPEVYEACPQWRNPNTKPPLAQFVAWWRRGGREARWIQPFAKPTRARIFILFERSNEDETAVLLAAETAVEAGIVAETSCDSPWGPFRFRVRVMPSLREEGIILSHFAISQEDKDPWSPKDLETPVARHLPKTYRMRAGTYARISEGFLYRPQSRNLSALFVLFVQDADISPDLVPHDADSLMAALARQLPPDTNLHGGFPDHNDEFLPLRYRLALTSRLLDIVDEPATADARRAPGVGYQALARQAHFACEHGDDKGREALQKWIDRDWRGAKHIKQALQECDQLLVTAAATGESSFLFDLLDNDERKPEVVSLLFNDDVIAGLTDSERLELARKVVERLLPEQTDDAVQFMTVVALRGLTGKEFGYTYFGHASARTAALRQWREWAAKQPHRS